MSDISLNGQKYDIVPNGQIKVKDVKSVDEIKNDFNDDIVVKNKDNKLQSISADEIDIKSKSWKPYVGLPAVGDKISLFADNKKVEGTVVYSEDENDLVTQSKKNMETLAKETAKAYEEGTKKGEKLFEQIQTKPQSNVTIEKKIEKILEKPEEKSTLDKVIDKTKEVAKNTTEYIQEKVEPQPSPKKEIIKAVDNITNKTGNIITDAIKEVTGTTLTVGQMDTHKEGNVDLGVNLSNNPTLNASYTFKVTKLDEVLHPLGSDLIKEPNSEIYFVSHSAGTRIGPGEISVGYKANLGVEFNRPFKDDFSVSVAGMTDVGFRPGGGAFWSMGVGLEGRYQLDKNMSIYGGPVVRNTLVGDKGKGSSVGLEAGLNIKF